MGISLGFATCGVVGFEARSDYAATGAVTNLVSRLADEVTGGQILISPRLYAEIDGDVAVEPVGEATLAGFQAAGHGVQHLAVLGKAAPESQLGRT